ncbi:MAG: glycosyltransferase family 2 protein [Prevotella sp.]
MKRHLQDCLDSILAMQMKDYEVLLIDDGSSDGSCDICKAYEQLDSRFHYYY